VSYDTVKGIERSLRSIEDFLALVEARHEAAYGRQEELGDFCVMGRYWLDSCGNFWLLERAKTVSDEPTVTAGRPLGGASLAGAMPRAVDTCQVCGQPWRIDNLEDCIALQDSTLVQNERRFYHRPCRVQELSVHQQAAFQEMFRAAGYGDVVMTTVANRYGSAIYRGPWFEVEVPGGVILIGWRKRVMNIDWSSTGCDLADKFQDVKDTKDQYHVHAWTDEQAVDYLRRIREALV
jgi:hypothetical protein